MPEYIGKMHDNRRNIQRIEASLQHSIFPVDQTTLLSHHQLILKHFCCVLICGSFCCSLAFSGSFLLFPVKKQCSHKNFKVFFFIPLVYEI